MQMECLFILDFLKLYLLLSFSFVLFFNIMTKSWRLPTVPALTTFCLFIYMICKETVASRSAYFSYSTYNSSISSLSSVKLNSLIIDLQENCCFNPIINRLGEKSHTREVRSQEKKVWSLCKSDPYWLLYYKQG